MRTRLVSERRAPAEAPELHALLQWRRLPPGAVTIGAIKACVALFAKDTTQLWPTRLRSLLQQLLCVFVAARAPGEQAAAYAALASVYIYIFF